MKPSFKDKKGRERWVTAAMVEYLNKEHAQKYIEFGEINIGKRNKIKADIVIDDLLAIECKGISSSSNKPDISKAIGQAITYTTLSYQAGIVAYSINDRQKKAICHSPVFGFEVTDGNLYLFTENKIEEYSDTTKHLYSFNYKKEYMELLQTDKNKINKTYSWLLQTNKSTERYRQHMKEAFKKIASQVNYPVVLTPEVIENIIYKIDNIKQGKLNTLINSLVRLYKLSPHLNIQDEKEIREVRNMMINL